MVWLLGSLTGGNGVLEGSVRTDVTDAAGDAAGRRKRAMKALRSQLRDSVVKAWAACFQQGGVG